jgi:hypothetical protein
LGILDLETVGSGRKRKEVSRGEGKDGKMSEGDAKGEARDRDREGREK